MCGCGNRGLASPMSFRRQSDHRRGGRWPSLTKPWRSGIVQDQNERKLELSLGPLRERHPQPGRAGHVSRVRSPHAKRGSASPLSRGPGSCWAGWSKASWERQLCLLPTPSLPSQPSEVPATNFPPKPSKADRILDSHLTPGSSCRKRAARTDTPPFHSPAPSGERRGEVANGGRP